MCQYFEIEEVYQCVKNICQAYRRKVLRGRQIILHTIYYKLGNMLKMVRVELIHRHHTSRDKSYMAPPPCLGIDSHQKHTEPEAMSTVGGLIEHKAVESEAHSDKLLRRKTSTHLRAVWQMQRLRRKSRQDLKMIFSPPDPGWNSSEGGR